MWEQQINLQKQQPSLRSANSESPCSDSGAAECKVRGVTEIRTKRLGVKHDVFCSEERTSHDQEVQIKDSLCDDPISFPAAYHRNRCRARPRCWPKKEGKIKAQATTKPPQVFVTAKFAVQTQPLARIFSLNVVGECCCALVHTWENSPNKTTRHRYKILCLEHCQHCQKKMKCRTCYYSYLRLRKMKRTKTSCGFRSFWQEGMCKGPFEKDEEKQKQFQKLFHLVGLRIASHFNGRGGKLSWSCCLSWRTFVYKLLGRLLTEQRMSFFVPLKGEIWRKTDWCAAAGVHDQVRHRRLVHADTCWLKMKHQKGLQIFVLRFFVFDPRPFVNQASFVKAGMKLTLIPVGVVPLSFDARSSFLCPFLSWKLPKERDQMSANEANIRELKLSEKIHYLLWTKTSTCARQLPGFLQMILWMRKVTFHLIRGKADVGQVLQPRFSSLELPNASQACWEVACSCESRIVCCIKQQIFLQSRTDLLTSCRWNLFTILSVPCCSTATTSHASCSETADADSEMQRICSSTPSPVICVPKLPNKMGNMTLSTGRRWKRTEAIPPPGASSSWASEWLVHAVCPDLRTLVPVSWISGPRLLPRIKWLAFFHLSFLEQLRDGL